MTWRWGPTLGVLCQPRRSVGTRSGSRPRHQLEQLVLVDLRRFPLQQRQRLQPLLSGPLQQRQRLQQLPLLSGPLQQRQRLPQLPLLDQRRFPLQQRQQLLQQQQQLQSGCNSNNKQRKQRRNNNSNSQGWNKQRRKQRQTHGPATAPRQTQEAAVSASSEWLRLGNWNGASATRQLSRWCGSQTRSCHDVLDA